MQTKDRVVRWFIKNIIVPKREIIDKPGFIITTFTEHDTTTFLREIFLPEKLFEMIENKIVEKYGNQGKQVLYSAGKKFGYLYSSMSNFPTVNNHSQKDLEEFLYGLVRYMEVTFSKQATHEANFDEKTFSISFKDYVICPHNGHGYIMTDGGSVGIWSYLVQDKKVEGIQTECQGRGNSQCVVKCWPKKKFGEKNDKIFQEVNLPEYKFDTMYKSLNKIQPTKYTTMSMKKLLDAKFFKYEEGNFFYKKNRFFGSESHILYILENEIVKLENGEKLLFDICYEFGRILQKNSESTDYEKFIMDFFSGVGFGESIFVEHDPPKIVTIFYPWSVYSEQSKYIIFRGILSGFVSEAMGKDIHFNNYKITIRDSLSLTIKPD